MNVTLTTIVTRIVSDQDENHEKRYFYPEIFTKDSLPENYTGTMRDFFDELMDSYIPIGMVRKNYIPQMFNSYTEVRTLTGDEMNLSVQEFTQSVRPTYMTPYRTNFTIMVTLAATLINS